MCYDIDGLEYMSDGLWTYILSGQGNIWYFLALTIPKMGIHHSRFTLDGQFRAPFC